MNKLSIKRRAQVAAALVEGASVRATARMTGVAFNTVLKMVADLGVACRAYHDQHVRGLKCRRLQADEIWAFCYAKDRNVPEAMKGMPGVGSLWTWTASGRSRI